MLHQGIIWKGKGVQTFGLHSLFKKQGATQNILSFISDIYVLVYELLNKHLNIFFYYTSPVSQPLKTMITGKFCQILLKKLNQAFKSHCSLNNRLQVQEAKGGRKLNQELGTQYIHKLKGNYAPFVFISLSKSNAKQRVALQSIWHIHPTFHLFSHSSILQTFYRTFYVLGTGTNQQSIRLSPVPQAI